MEYFGDKFNFGWCKWMIFLHEKKETCKKKKLGFCMMFTFSLISNKNLPPKLKTKKIGIVVKGAIKIIIIITFIRCIGWSLNVTN